MGRYAWLSWSPESDPPCFSYQPMTVNRWPLMVMTCPSGSLEGKRLVLMV